MASTRIGISGWRYPPWRGTFYPDGLAQRRELEFVAHRFASVEINGSFYSLQRPETYAEWHAQSPPGFVFAVKGSRFITHILRLKDVGQALANFFASGLFELREKLGPFLWQFPQQMRFDAERFDAFFSQLPRDTDQAAALARRRDARLHGRARLKPRVALPLRHAVEIRHPSFACHEFLDLLRRHGIAAVFADTAGRWPYFEDLTADFAYLRLHGDVELYTSGYTEEALQRWARRIDAWGRGAQVADAVTVDRRNAASNHPRDVYCYFDNDVKVRAPFDARRLTEILGLADGLEPMPQFREPKGGWASGLGPRASGRYVPVFKRASSSPPAVRRRTQPAPEAGARKPRRPAFR